MIAATACAALSALLTAAASLAGSATRAPAPTVSISGPTTDTLPSVTPSFTISASGFSPTGGAVTVTLQIARTPDFALPLVDTSVVGTSATIHPSRPLPDRSMIYWRAIARSASGELAVSETVGPRTSATWLRLISPNQPTGTTVESTRPEFIWSSARVDSPPGPWLYDLAIVNVARQDTIVVTGLLDTAFVLGIALEANTSYRWSVLARLSSGDSIRVRSLGTFVIQNPNAPLATILYQNFPNPFPTAGSGVTCVWFDLRSTGAVRLDVYDLRGNHVRRLLPPSGVPQELVAGRYGRGSAGGDSGCDPRFTWDGADDSGRTVDPGVYLLRLRADGADVVRKMLFRGR